MACPAVSVALCRLMLPGPVVVVWHAVTAAKVERSTALVIVALSISAGDPVFFVLNYWFSNKSRFTEGQLYGLGKNWEIGGKIRLLHQSIFGNRWCCREDSNFRPLHYQWSALPLSYGSNHVGGGVAPNKASGKRISGRLRHPALDRPNEQQNRTAKTKKTSRQTAGSVEGGVKGQYGPT